jgi:hypothetical protein
LIYSYINTSGNLENEKLCGNTTPLGRSVFTQFRVFPISTSVDITIYQYGKNVLYLFYNIAQRNIKTVSVLTLSYINTALSQSAFRIYKCYIIICNILISSIMNSLVIVLFLSGMVAMIMLRTLHRDIARYNQLDTSVSCTYRFG